MTMLAAKDYPWSKSSRSACTQPDRLSLSRFRRLRSPQLSRPDSAALVKQLSIGCPGPALRNAVCRVAHPQAPHKDADLRQLYSSRAQRQLADPKSSRGSTQRAVACRHGRHLAQRKYCRPARRSQKSLQTQCASNCSREASSSLAAHKEPCHPCR